MLIKKSAREVTLSHVTAKLRERESSSVAYGGCCTRYGYHKNMKSDWVVLGCI